MDFLEKMTGLRGPKLHVLELGAGSREGFVQGLELGLPPEFCRVLLPGEELASPDQLFALCQTAFSFPEYYGRNWDALDECLNDLEWLGASGYLIWIDQAERIALAEPDFTSFINILERTAREWSQGRSEGAFATAPRPFHVLFTVGPGMAEALMKRLQTAGVKAVELLEDQALGNRH